MSEQRYQFVLDFEVRDYECDMEGIVNNAVYQNYLEHARHRFFGSIGKSFARVVADGFVPLVVRAEIDYRRSLRSGDRFTVRLRVEREGRLRIVFVQDIFREGEEEPVVNARIISTITNGQGRPLPVEKVDPVFAAALLGSSIASTPQE
jgi:acyl-CoA thioester hydrolase